MWQPTARIDYLKVRAEVLAKIREFFAIRGVMEVETPLLCYHTVSDPYIQSLSAEYRLPGEKVPQKFYLQTSPEYAMKRLLAAGSGPIYQICKAFREDGKSTLHNPEFTMLEWYRPGFTHRDLMLEMDGLLRRVLNCEVARSHTYAELFQTYCELDPHTASLSTLKAAAEKHHIELLGSEKLNDPTTWLQILMAQVIEPHLGQNNRPSFVTDFPLAQAALSRINPGPPPVAERFEVYWKGMELANGFHELCDAKEQRARFEKNNEVRKAQGLEVIAIDGNFLAALEHGLPRCAGVALGVDRLVMAALDSMDIKDTLTFPIDRA